MTKLRIAIGWLPILVLAPVVAAQLVFFAAHAANVLAYPYPLDYGEGPLLAQVQQLQRGMPIWALYGDPAAAPYLVVNYPPVYHLATLPLALALGLIVVPDWALLLAGRLISLLATLAAVGALWNLAGEPRRATDEAHEAAREWPAVVLRLLVTLAFLGIPIVREWAVVMRVDTLGVCLGLWGLVLLRRCAAGSGGAHWPALLLGLSLLVKPSLIAAPAGAIVWLWFRDRKRAAGLIGSLALFGGVICGLLMAASGGWFFTHVVAANINPIDQRLAAGFWEDQLAIMWPLVVGGGVGALSVGALSVERWCIERWGGGRFALRDRGVQFLLNIARFASGGGKQTAIDASTFHLLPIYYTLFGAVVALGVGKVGAYANYFLEFYGGLVWLVALSVERWRVGAFAGRLIKEADHAHDVAGVGNTQRSTLNAQRTLGAMISLVIPLLLTAALLRYYPLWSETFLKPYGLIEGENPARVAFGSYGVWQDLAREREVLRALGQVHGALVGEVRAVGEPILTDLPGIAAQAGQLARHQAFEHRQLYDAGLWDQRPLLRDLASGRVPLVALDYLGNWLTPELITLITHRYAQDGSRGPYDLYRPVETGSLQPTVLDFPGGLSVTGVRLAPSGGASYSGGELLAVTLEWRVVEGVGSLSGPCDTQPDACEVLLQLRATDDTLITESTEPLLYGALPPQDWGGETVQHMQTLALPPTLPPGEYTLATTLRASGQELAPARSLARMTVRELTGRVLGAGGYFVPEPLLEVWAREGGYDGPGDPLMPAVPFEGFTAQCFQRACYRLEGSVVKRVPLGELMGLVETNLLTFDSSDNGSGPLMDFYERSGGNDALGEVIGFTRGEREVVYTQYARFEYGPDGAPQLAKLGDEFLRLPGGVPYRWPGG